MKTTQPPKNPPFHTNIDPPAQFKHVYLKEVKQAYDSDSQLDGAAMTRTASRTKRGLGQQLHDKAVISLTSNEISH